LRPGVAAASISSCGRLYLHTTNPRIATADGIGLAASVGASIRDMEFMQFHPTTLYHPQLRSFLVTEAVRGVGGTLRNHLGTRFMYDYDPRLELAPRDIVSRAIDAEMRKLDTWCVYLDVTHLPKEQIRAEFPTIWDRLDAVGIAMYKHWIPVVPAQHYACGGVSTDLAGRTTVPGLYAAGEVASTGVHGANRLASNSLLEAIVFAFAAAESLDASERMSDGGESIRRRSVAEADAVRIRRSLQKTMTDHVFIVRRTAGLEQARHRIAALREEYGQLPEAPFSSYSLETENLLIAATYVVDGALARRKNVGLHYNADFEESETTASSA